jgi:hypothetical protein
VLQAPLLHRRAARPAVKSMNEAGSSNSQGASDVLETSDSAWLQTGTWRLWCVHNARRAGDSDAQWGVHAHNPCALAGPKVGHKHHGLPV